MDDFDRARAISADVVATAEAIHDDVQVGIGLSTLAVIETSLGRFPQALAYRERVEAIRRRQNDDSALPYDLANRAELLIRLGRLDDGSRVLGELEAGIKAGIEAYVGRAPRAVYLRALAAATSLRPQEAVRALKDFTPSGGVDQVSILAPPLLEYAQARLGRRTASGTPAAAGAKIDASLARERQYWRAAAAIEQGRAAQALAEAERGLALLGGMSNDELRWRLSALGSLALRAMGAAGRAREMRVSADEALKRMQADWRNGVEAYVKRPDVAELMARLGPA
jgi:tetratricopeptide (TPR) repeat protein